MQACFTRYCILAAHGALEAPATRVATSRGAGLRVWHYGMRARLQEIPILASWVSRLDTVLATRARESSQRNADSFTPLCQTDVG
eukprot:3863325-Pleurochrysis_carterae.AAC.4